MWYNHHYMYLPYLHFHLCAQSNTLQVSRGAALLRETTYKSFLFVFCSTQLFFDMILRPSIVLVVAALAAAAIAQEEAPEVIEPEVIEIASTTLQPEEIIEITTVAPPEDGKMFSLLHLLTLVVNVKWLSH